MPDTAKLVAEVRNGHGLCAHCGERPAACFGQYEAMPEPELACNECCAHGCEDGKCILIAPQLADAVERLQARLLTRCAEHSATLDAIALALGTKERGTYAPSELPVRVERLRADLESAAAIVEHVKKVAEKAQADNARLREMLVVVASPLRIDGENHAASVKQARALLAETEVDGG